MAKAKAAVQANPSIGRKKLIRLCGCTAFAAAKFLKSGDKPVQVCVPVPAAKPQGGEAREPKEPRETLGVSVREFGSRFDFEAKLRKTIKTLCGDRFVADADVRTHCDIPIPSFRAVAAMPEFMACQIKEGGTVWWSARENVEEVRAKARKWGISK